MGFGLGGLGGCCCCCPFISINNLTETADVTEGNAGTSGAVLTVTLSCAPSEDITVEYETSDVTATAGSDYTATSGTLTIAAGQTTGKITVLISGDTTPEQDEDFIVTLSNPSGCAELDPDHHIGTVTIANDDVSSCECDEEFLPLELTLEVSGIDAGTHPFPCTDCDANLNGTFVLEFDGNCTWVSESINLGPNCGTVAYVVTLGDTGGGLLNVTIKLLGFNFSLGEWHQAAAGGGCLTTPASLGADDLTTSATYCDVSSATLLLSV